MRRLLALSMILYGLFLTGLATFNGALLALALPLVIYLGAALFDVPQDVRLEAKRALSADRVPEGTLITITVSIKNMGSHLEEVLVDDSLPSGLTLVNGATRRLLSLTPGESMDMTYTVQALRGKYALSHVQVTVSDRFALFHQRLLLSAPSELTVLPQLLKAQRIGIRPLRTRAYAGPVPARQGGSGVEFFGVRAYQPGDPQRWINWRASARHLQEIYSNEFQQERIADVGLILDARQRTDVRVGDQRLFEYSVRATASLADAFLHDGNRVALLIYGEWLNWIFPGYGKVQRHRILDALADAQTGDSMIFESLNYVPTRFFPPGSQIVLISPLCYEDLSMLVRLRTRGYQVLVVSPDPVSFEARCTRPDKDVALAARIARLERRLLLRKMQQAGVRVVDWQVDQPLDQAIHVSFSRLPQWFRVVGWEE